jgi:hypothetical protein
MIERHNNFVRSKIHQRRGFRSLKTGELQIGLLFAYYNFIREHSAIKTTPGEKAGIIDYGGKTSEKGRWLLIIRRAAQNANFI